MGGGGLCGDSFNTPLEMHNTTPDTSEKLVRIATFNTPLEMRFSPPSILGAALSYFFQYSVGDARD